MICPLADLKIFLDVAVTDNSQDAAINLFHNAVEKWIKEYCHRDFEQTAYTNKLYNGTGGKYLYLDDFPIVSIARISTTIEDAIKIKNTSSDATYATVAVDTTQLSLVVHGGTNETAGTETVPFVPYNTMTKVVDRVNVIASGWSAALVDADYGDLESSDLIECQAKYCGARANTTASWEYLEMAGEPIADFRFNSDAGEIYRSAGFSSGYRNIVVTYTAGYSATTMPGDLKMAIMMAVKYLYQKRDWETVGVSEFSLGHLRVKYADILPPETLAIINKYKLLAI